MNRILSLKKNRSGEAARIRLKTLLTADRTGCSAEILEMIKHDICHVAAKYMEVDCGELTVTVTRASYAGSPKELPILTIYLPIHSLTNKGTC